MSEEIDTRPYKIVMRDPGGYNTALVGRACPTCKNQYVYSMGDGAWFCNCREEVPNE